MESKIPAACIPLRQIECIHIIEDELEGCGWVEVHSIQHPDIAGSIGRGGKGIASGISGGGEIVPANEVRIGEVLPHSLVFIA